MITSALLDLGKLLLFFLVSVYNLFIINILMAQESGILSEANKRDFITYGVSDKILIETDVKDARAAIDFWIGKMGQAMNLNLKGYVYSDLDSLYKDFRNNKLDIANITLVDYLRLWSDVEAELGPVPLKGGKKSRNYFLIGRSNSLISGIHGLKGKKLAVAKDNEAGRIFIDTFLLQNQLQESAGYFSDIIEKRTFSQAVLSVFFGQADACITADYAFNTLAELNPQIKANLAVVTSSPSFPETISLYRKDLDKDVKKTMSDMMCGLDNTEAGRQVRILFMIDGMEPADESDIKPFRDLLRLYEYLGGVGVKLKGNSNLSAK